MDALITHNSMRDNTVWPSPPGELANFHHRMPAYSPTNLLDAPLLAQRLGVRRLLIKAETRRMGLPSFKILGASWATYRALCDHLGYEPEPWRNINELAANVAHLRPFTLATATDGNHGRAVAFMARLLGFRARIFVPVGMSDARIGAMEAEGATVTVVDGDYDDAVARAAKEQSASCLVVSDTSWEGYQDIPNRVIEGYTTIFNEVDEAIVASGLEMPDAVVIPMGVGAFMASAVTHYRSGQHQPIIIGVEPRDANCVQESARHQAITHVPGPHRSIMVGLNCGLPSQIAWPRLASGIDWFVSVGDDAACQAMRDLANAAVVAGETGAASLAGLEALLESEHVDQALPNRSEATVLIVVTEGATDPAAYEKIVGRRHETVGRVLTAIRSENEKG